MRTAFATIRATMLGGLALTSTACQSSSSDTESNAPMPVESSMSSAPTIVGTWIVQTIDGVPVSEMMEKSLRSPSLTILEDGTINGFSGVNTFRGSLSPADMANGVFEPGPMAMTMMAGPPDAMRVESRFMQDLNAANGFTIVGNTLNLTEGGMTLLTFSPGS